MKNTALVIMAAGIGSRFGGGIKQLEPVGPSGEIIMDYSIHYAMQVILFPCKISHGSRIWSITYENRLVYVQPHSYDAASDDTSCQSVLY